VGKRKGKLKKKPRGRQKLKWESVTYGRVPEKKVAKHGCTRGKIFRVFKHPHYNAGVKEQG